MKGDPSNCRTCTPDNRGRGISLLALGPRLDTVKTDVSKRPRYSEKRPISDRFSEKRPSYGNRDLDMGKMISIQSYVYSRRQMLPNLSIH